MVSNADRIFSRPLWKFCSWTYYSLWYNFIIYYIVYVCVYIYTYIHMYIHTYYIHVYIITNTKSYMYICVLCVIYIYIYKFICIYVCVYLHVIHIYIHYLYMYVFVCIYICKFINTITCLVFFVYQLDAQHSYLTTGLILYTNSWVKMKWLTYEAGSTDTLRPDAVIVAKGTTLPANYHSSSHITFTRRWWIAADYHAGCTWFCTACHSAIRTSRF